ARDLTHFIINSLQD
ncbi:MULTISPECIES: two-component system connector SafA, partial [Enterobacteriaceae]|nr:two-component system connector SafA [Escherichia coli]HBA3253961.1 hypothetical protein [Escherichia coli]HDW2123870.1 two-component system connector SafA [Escherichia coli]